MRARSRRRSERSLRRESAADVSELPNQARPRVDWVSANPARALATLCDALGCRVVLDLDDAVSIRRVGVGAELPDLGIQRTESFGIDPFLEPQAHHQGLVRGFCRQQHRFFGDGVAVALQRQKEILGLLVAH